MMQDRWAVVLPSDDHDNPDVDTALARYAVDPSGNCQHCGVFVDRKKEPGLKSGWGWHVERLLTDEEVVVAGLTGKLVDYMEAEDKTLWEERKSWLGTE